MGGTLQLANGSSNAMFVDANGNVGIGTTIPLTKLDVKGNINVNNIFLKTGAITNDYDISANIPNSVWTNIILTTNLSGLKAGLITFSLWGAVVYSVQTIVEDNYSGSPNSIIDYPYATSIYKFRISGGYLQAYQGSGGNATVIGKILRLY